MFSLKLNVLVFLVLVSLELYHQQETDSPPISGSTSPFIGTTTTMAPSDNVKRNTSQIIENLIKLVKDNPEFWYENEEDGFFTLGQMPIDYDKED